MDSNDIEKLRKLIERLGEAESPKDAEPIMQEILEPLLKEQEYGIRAVGLDKGVGVDFIASKVALNGDLIDEIAIEYKHFRNKSVNLSVVEHVIGTASTLNVPRAMLVTNSKFTMAARRSLQLRAPVKIELIDTDAMLSWVSRLEEVPLLDIAQVHIIRRTVSRSFIDLILKNPRYLDEIEWREMERLLSEVFEGLGFGVELTPGSKDGGKDIILTCKVSSGSHRYYVEIKHWRSRQNVGSGAITEFLNLVINEEDVSGGLFLSTYGFCSGAIESLTEIQRKTLRFGSEEKVVSLCKSYVKAASGIWTPEGDISDILYENTD